MIKTRVTPSQHHPKPRFGGYVGDEAVCYGAASVVWKGHTGRAGGKSGQRRFADVAMKVPFGPSAASALRNEAEHLAEVRHPHLVDVLAATESGIVLPWYPGGTLSRHLKTGGPLTPGQSVTALAPVAEAVAAMHSRGLVHGDVSPGNVLLTSEGKPVLGDLGACAPVGTRYRFRGLHADLDFLEPDRVTGKADLADDIFALGRVLAAVVPSADTGIRGAAGSGVPAEFRELILASTQPATLKRPSAIQWLTALYCLADPEPLCMPAANGSSVHADFTAHSQEPIALGELRTATMRRRLSRSTERPTGSMPARELQKSGLQQNESQTDVRRRLGMLRMLGKLGRYVAPLKTSPRIWLISSVLSLALLFPIAAATGLIPGSGRQGDSTANSSEAGRVLQSLATRRDEFMMAGEHAAGVYVPGSAADVAGRQLTRRLAGADVSGLTTTIEDAQVRSGDAAASGLGSELVVSATVHTSAYSISSTDEATDRASGSRQDLVRFDLRLMESGWRIDQIDAQYRAQG